MLGVKGQLWDKLWPLLLLLLLLWPSSYMILSDNEDRSYVTDVLATSDDIIEASSNDGILVGRSDENIWSSSSDITRSDLSYNATMQDLVRYVDGLVDRLIGETHSSGGLRSSRSVGRSVGDKMTDLLNKSLVRNMVDVGACLACQIFYSAYFRLVRADVDMYALDKFSSDVCPLVLFTRREYCARILRREMMLMNYVIKRSNDTAEQYCNLFVSTTSPPDLPNYPHCREVYQGPHWTVDLPPLPREPRGIFSKGRGRGKNAAPGACGIFVMPARGHSTTATFLNAIQKFLTCKSRVFEASRFEIRQSLKGASSKPALKMLHITDVHYDPYYRQGSNTECRNIMLCCQVMSGPASSPSVGAGKWGDYRRCDAPRRLVVHMLRTIRDKHKDIDYIVWTGDNVAHDMWNLNRNHSREAILTVGALVKQYFPGVPVFGSLGNHETSLRNNFSPPEDPTISKKFSNQWLYNLLADQWQSFLPDQKISPQARITGSYSALVKPGFRIISINSNFCYKFNWWILYKSQDPGNVLRWLVQELTAAEDAGEFVHIIGHIPPLSSHCYEQWGQQYNRIIARFSGTVRAQFFGHQHFGQIYVNYDPQSPSKSTGVQYMTPTFGTWPHYNPTYTIYTVDGDQTNRGLLDMETYYMNLTAANLVEDTRLLPLFSAAGDLELPSLEPSSWYDLALKMKGDDEFLQRYYRYMAQASDPSLRRGCGPTCKEKILRNMLQDEGRRNAARRRST